MAEAVAAEAAPPKSGGKTMMIVAVLAALIIGAGAAYFLASGGSDNEGDDKVEKQSPSVFFPLETFTVNLVPEFGDQYLQVEMTLKVSGQDIIDEVKRRMPEVRNRVIMILSSKRASELTTVSGKSALAQTLNVQLNMLIDPTYKPPMVPLKKVDQGDNPSGTEPAATETPQNAKDKAPSGPIREVLFTSFIVQ
jgi:flagellar FliL protein